MATKRSLAESMCPDDMYDDDDECGCNPNEMTIRFKWLADGATNIDQIIERLHEEIAWYTKLKYDGWVLRAPIEDDYGFLHKPFTVPEDGATAPKRPSRRG